MWQTDDEVSKNEKETKQTGGNDHEKKNIEGSKYLKNTCVLRTFVTNFTFVLFFLFFYPNFLEDFVNGIDYKSGFTDVASVVLNPYINFGVIRSL